MCRPGFVTPRRLLTGNTFLQELFAHCIFVVGQQSEQGVPQFEFLTWFCVLANVIQSEHEVSGLLSASVHGVHLKSNWSR
jgi:hypothetical protein